MFGRPELSRIAVGKRVVALGMGDGSCCRFLGVGSLNVDCIEVWLL